MRIAYKPSLSGIALPETSASSACSAWGLVSGTRIHRPMWLRELRDCTVARNTVHGVRKLQEEQFEGRAMIEMLRQVCLTKASMPLSTSSPPLTWLSIRAKFTARSGRGGRGRTTACSERCAAHDSSCSSASALSCRKDGLSESASIQGLILPRILGKQQRCSRTQPMGIGKCPEHCCLQGNTAIRTLIHTPNVLTLLGSTLKSPALCPRRNFTRFGCHDYRPDAGSRAVSMLCQTHPRSLEPDRL